MLFLISFVDGIWGAFNNIGENLLKNGRLCFLNKVILTPSHHRIHHARNPFYMDTNFCNLLNIWDKVFGTNQEEKNNIEIEYGITRKMNSGNFFDVYFGEIVALSRDVAAASGFSNKIKYIVNPLVWHHTGKHKTAKVTRGLFPQGVKTKVATTTQWSEA